MGFSFDPGESSKTMVLKKLSSYFLKKKKKKQVFNDRLTYKKLFEEKKFLLIESKQKLQSFVLPHPHSIFLLWTLYF